MTSFKTPASAIPSSRNRHCLVRLSGVLVLLAAAPQAGAHGMGDRAIPESPGVRLGVATVVSWYDADAPLPSAQLPGVVLTGVPAEDRTESTLEHGTLDVGWRISEMFGATAALGWHGDGASHVEAAWLNANMSGLSGEWILGAGRRHVPMGPALDVAGNFDRFGLMPIAKRAALDNDWIEDGANLRWMGHGAIPIEVDLGLWRGRQFPSAGKTDIFPQLHVGADIGDVRVDGFVARVSADGRGTYIQRSQSGHSHGVPSCDGSLLQVACFEGDVDLAGGSLRWSIDDYALDIIAAGMYRHDRGDLYSSSGNTRYDGRSTGGWLETVWGFRPNWSLAVRLEGMEGKNRLSGYGASLVARELGLLPDPGLSKRATLALAWSPFANGTVWAEVGKDWNDQWTNNFVGLRLIWQAELRRSVSPKP